MTSKKELVLKAFNNEVTERVPVGFWFHFVPDEIIDALAYPELKLAEQNIEGHRKFIAGFKPDLVKVMSDGYFIYPLEGGKPAAGDAGDLDRIRVIDAGHEWIQKQVEIARKVTAMQDDTLYFYNVFSPATTFRFMVGYEKFINLLKTEPEALSAALQRMGQGIAALVKAVINEGGADGIYFSVQNPDINRVSDDEYHRRLTASDKVVLDAANAASENNILHICGYDGVKNHLGAWKDYHAKAYNWAANVEGVSLAEGKKLFGGACVIGGFANPPGSLIQTGTKAEIEAFTDTIIRKTGKRGLIVGADCTVPRGTPLEHLEWIRLAAARPNPPNAED
jgi:uroporphyrinogen decarboxylase